MEAHRPASTPIIFPGSQRLQGVRISKGFSPDIRMATASVMATEREKDVAMEIDPKEL